MIEAQFDYLHRLDSPWAVAFCLALVVVPSLLGLVPLVLTLRLSTEKSSQNLTPSSDLAKGAVLSAFLVVGIGYIVNYLVGTTELQAE